MPATPGTARFRLTAAPKKPTQSKLPRRSHIKSRNGCQICKRSRVKCDEQRPVCGRCAARRFSCIYVNDFEPHILTVAPPLAMGDGLMANGYPGLEHSDSRHHSITESTYLMQHLPSCLDASLGSPVGRDLFDRFVLPQCASTPYLMHALLALSARHLQHCQTSTIAHRRASWLHTQAAAQLLGEQLGNYQIGAQNVDWIYACSLLLNIVSFAFDKTTAYRPWVLESSAIETGNSLNWFTVQIGLGHLKKILHQNVEHSFWRLKDNTLGASVSTHCQRSNLAHLKDESFTLPSLLYDLYDVAPGSSSLDNPYYFPLQLIIPMLQKETLNVDDMNKLLGFGPTATVAYRSLLYAKDERALLLFMLWLDLLGRGDVQWWWLTDRVRNERPAISSMLSRSHDSRILDILALYRATRLPIRLY